VIWLLEGNICISYIKTIKLTPFIKFSKLAEALLKNNLKLQTKKHETAKQKIINSRAEFPTKIIILCQKNVSENLPNRHEKSNRSNKKPNFIWPFEQ